MRLKKNKIFLYARLVCFTMLFTHCVEMDLFYDSDYFTEELNAKDSIAVRAILDVNGLTGKNVRDVIEIDYGMARKMRLDSFALTRFVITKAFDSCEQDFKISITNSVLETLTIIDTVHINLMLDIHSTKLKNIPDQISLLKGRLGLYLSDNQLNFISPEIMKCSIRDIDVRNNELCSLPDSLAGWIDKESSQNGWRSAQTCQ